MKGNCMSGIKEVLFEMMEQDHRRAVSQQHGEFTEEEMAMARYDHTSSDAASYNDREVSDEE